MNKKLVVYLMFVLAIIFTTFVTGNINAAGTYPQKIGPFGGSSTQTFDDFSAIPPQTPITKLVISWGDVLDSVQVYYGNTALPTHGVYAGNKGEFKIAPNDYLTEISGFYGTYFGATHLCQVTLKTHLGKTSKSFGSGANMKNKKAFSLKTTSDTEQIIALYGGSYKHTDGTDYISSLGAYITANIPPRKIGPYGGNSTGDLNFDDYSAIPASTTTSTITKLVITSGDIVDSVQVFYGNTAMPKHGGDTGDQSVVNIDSTDALTEISGFYGTYFGVTHILQITFKTHLGKTYGPYGKGVGDDKKAFSLKTTNDAEQIIALFGGSYKHTDGSNYISALGAYVR